MQSGLKVLVLEGQTKILADGFAFDVIQKLLQMLGIFQRRVLIRGQHGNGMEQLFSSVVHWNHLAVGLMKLLYYIVANMSSALFGVLKKRSI